MGVPSFYRWLVNKYPNVVVKAKEAKGEEIETTEPNPNGIEFDNLYLDLNGIIHPCFHPDDQDPPTTFEQVFESICEYIDWLFRIVRPRKLLFMAIDGVAPRAKMNQQRSRRFRTAKDAEIAEAEEDKIRKEFETEGKKVLPKQKSQVSDSNIITPGTEFMEKLSQALEVYVRERLNSDPGWKGIKVILSDANAPGEGEHKIMKFIRLQRNCNGYDPNTRHCLYGLDADLIMLALATHEIHFSILREDVLAGQQPCIIPPLQTCNSGTFPLSEACQNKWESRGVSKKPYQKPYQFLNIWTFREYLELEMNIPDPPFEIDIERIVDDFIFICFFTGNDFLPHMPSLEIREGAIDLLMAVYKDQFKSRGGYLVNTEKLEEGKAGCVELKSIEKFILAVGTYEERIFKKRIDLHQRMIKKLYQQMANDLDDLEIEEEPFIQFPIGELKSESTLSRMHNISQDNVLINTEELKRKVKDVMREKSDLFKQGCLEKDKIKLGTEGWKERYYAEKFSAESSKDIEDIRKKIVEKYTEGLCWVLHYYFFGVRSWTWFYPYHYGPFASDLKGLNRVKISLNMGEPFKPFEQLMGVLPPRSVYALPKAYWHLMTSEESKVIHFYPTDFDVDVDGKRHLWQGIVKLPFIDEKRLLSEMKKLENELKEDEVRRNSHSMEKLFVLSSHGLGPQVVSLYGRTKPAETNTILSINSCASGGMNGFISPCCKDPVLSSCTLCLEGIENFMEGDVVCARYEHPKWHRHIPRLLENVTIPEKTITEADIVEQQLWHEYEGHRPTNRSVINGGKPTSSDPVPAKEKHIGAGPGWRGRGNGAVETSHSTCYNLGRARMLNNVKPAASSSSSEPGQWNSVRGRGRMELSRSTTSGRGRMHTESPAASSSLANGEGYVDSRWNQTSVFPMRTRASSGSNSASGRWVAGRGRGYVESTRRQPTNTYCTNKHVNVGNVAQSSVGPPWAGAGSNKCLGKGKGYTESLKDQTSGSYYSLCTVNVERLAPTSVGRVWAEAGSSEALGQGKGYIDSSWNQSNSSYMSSHNMDIKKSASSAHHNWAGVAAKGSIAEGNGPRTLNSGRGFGYPVRTWAAKSSFQPSRKTDSASNGVES